MPSKINMVITNGNISPALLRSIMAPPTLGAAKPKAPPTALNSSIIARIHSVKPGCGSCGRK